MIQKQRTQGMKMLGLKKEARKEPCPVLMAKGENQRLIRRTRKNRNRKITRDRKQTRLLATERTIKIKTLTRIETTETIARDKRSALLLVRTTHPPIEVVGEEGMMGDEACKIVGDATMAHRRDEEGAMIIEEEEEEGALVAILRIGEDQMARLREEEDDMTKTIVVTGTVIIEEEIDLVETDPIDPVVEITIGVVKKGEAPEETIIVVVDLVMAEVVGDDGRTTHFF
mmetsp:Transcript_9426/g.23486  ORF Transcript_9426/g.23486 Transcript_9426/m.23486 type:complete len:228 (-) Transcript_9426:286-969(-)